MTITCNGYESCCHKSLRQHSLIAVQSAECACVHAISVIDRCHSLNVAFLLGVSMQQNYQIRSLMRKFWLQA